MNTFTVILRFVPNPSIERQIVVQAENAVRACRKAQIQEGPNWLAYEAEIAN